MDQRENKADSDTGKADGRSDIGGAENGINQKKSQDNFNQEGR